MSTTLVYDAALAARIETVYATPDVAATRVAAFRAAAPRLGEKGLDVGCGPGYLTRELAIAVGIGGRITAVDLSEPMLALAGHRCDGLTQVEFKNADARRMPVPNASVDFACALQVYCYVKDLDDALAELHRVLKPGGRAVILDTDFSGVVWESRDRARMQKVMRAFDEHAAWPDLPRVLPARLAKAGFDVTRCEAVPFVTLAYHPNTYVYGLARFIHQFVVSNTDMPAEDAEAWLDEFDVLERQRAFFYSTNRFMFVATRS
jgi:SAM-dependent methyltransferase